MIANLVDGEIARGDASRSLVTVSGTGIEVPTVLMQERNMLVRLFNAEGDGAERTITLGVNVSRVQVMELDGRITRTLNVRRNAAGASEVSMAIPRFGIRTLRCELV